MSEYSQRVCQLTPSATVRISDRAEQLRSEGVDIIDMSAGDPDFSTPANISEVAKRAIDDGDTHYTASRGIDELRSSIVDKLQSENDIPATEDGVVVTPGAKQGIFEVLSALIETGDEVAVLDPAWVSYESLIKFVGGSVTRVRMDPETGFSLGSVDLSKAVSDDTKAMIVNTPANPTGAVYSREELSRIGELAVEHDIWLIADEIYEKLIYEGEHHSLAAMDGLFDRTITINGLSKSHAMTGWRLGYYAGPKETIDQAAKVHSHTVTCATSFVQRGAIEALEGDQWAVEEMRSEFHSRRDLLMNKLDEYGVEIPAPQGAFYAFIPLASSDDIELCERMLTEDHVATTPGSAFGVSGYARISYANSKSSIEEGIDRIGKYLGQSSRSNQ